MLRPDLWGKAYLASVMAWLAAQRMGVWIEIKHISMGKKLVLKNISALVTDIDENIIADYEDSTDVSKIDVRKEHGRRKYLFETSDNSDEGTYLEPTTQTQIDTGSRFTYTPPLRWYERCELLFNTLLESVFDIKRTIGINEGKIAQMITTDDDTSTDVSNVNKRNERGYQKHQIKMRDHSNQENRPKSTTRTCNYTCSRSTLAYTHSSQRYGESELLLTTLPKSI